jgi:hypothetical protein
MVPVAGISPFVPLLAGGDGAVIAGAITSCAIGVFPLTLGGQPIAKTMVKGAIAEGLFLLA